MVKKILTIDEEPHITHLIRHNLERAGYRAEEMNPPPQPDVEELVSEILKLRPNLIVTEWRSADLTVEWGRPFLKAIKGNPKTADIPVIVLMQLRKDDAQEEQDRLVWQCWQSGVDCTLTKPFNPLELVTFVKRIFEALKGNDLDDDDYINPEH